MEELEITNKRPHPVSRYLKVCRFLEYFGKAYSPTARLILLANQEDDLSKEQLKGITGTSESLINESLKRLVNEGLLSRRDSQLSRYKQYLYQVNYDVLDLKVEEWLGYKRTRVWFDGVRHDDDDF